jgi:hypothetical protein
MSYVFFTTEDTEFHGLFSSIILYILSFIPFCHSDDRREEESRVHPLVFSLLYVHEILRYTPFRSG